MNMEHWRPKTALVSVTDKTGIGPFGRGLAERGITIHSTGGTAKELQAAGVPVTDVAELVRGSWRTILARHGIDEHRIAAILEETGGQFLGDRVKTLSREKSAALLAQRTPEDEAELVRIGVPMVDIVVCNFYELEKAIATPGITEQQVIAKTDVGGPTMAHEAAKGRRLFVADPSRYDEVLAWFDAGCPDLEATLRKSAAEADWMSGKHVLTSGIYHGQGAFAAMLGRRISPCKYGENPFLQPAALYAEAGDDPLALHRFTVVDGDAPSYINWTDVHRLIESATRTAAGCEAKDGSVPVEALGGKHGEVSNASISDDAGSAIRGMLDGDRIAIFGGAVLLTCPVGKEEAELLRLHGTDGGPKRLLDVVVAPSFTEEAVAILGRKGGKCRCIANGALAHLTRASLDQAPRLRPVRGGFLMQPANAFVLDLNDPRVVVHGEITDADRTNIVLAWAVGSTSKSNTITLVKHGMVVANAVGQQDRVGAAQLAIMRARRNGHDIRGAVAYSDSFFPFPDGPAALIEAGVRVIFASSGSVRDDEVIAVCKAAGVTLVMMPDKDCRGFYGH